MSWIQIVIPSGVPPTQFYLTDVRRQNVLTTLPNGTDIEQNVIQIDKDVIKIIKNWRKLRCSEAQKNAEDSKRRPDGSADFLQYVQFSDFGVFAPDDGIYLINTLNIIYIYISSSLTLGCSPWTTTLFKQYNIYMCIYFLLTELFLARSVGPVLTEGDEIRGRREMPNV